MSGVDFGQKGGIGLIRGKVSRVERGGSLPFRLFGRERRVLRAGQDRVSVAVSLILLEDEEDPPSFA